MSQETQPMLPMPEHVAIIMDGNGRWAKEKGENRIHGHQNGIESVRDMVEGCGEIGVKYLTLYAFSTENWKRPKEEVDALMSLLVTTIRSEIEKLKSNNVRLHVIGDIEALPEAAQKELREGMEMTREQNGLNLILALSYSARWEIRQAVKKIAAKAQNGTLNIDQIDDQVIQQHLATAAFPDPELLIRTGGEHRISNFLLYQIAYSELYFTDIHWPDFRKHHLMEAIHNYRTRERRFGLTSDQVR